MPKDNPSMLDSLLATAAAQAEQKQAESKAEQKRIRKAEKTEATEATNTMFAAVAEATGKAMTTGGHPAVTNLMGGIVAHVTGSTRQVPAAQTHTSTPEQTPQTSVVSQSDFDAVVAEKDDLKGQLSTANQFAAQWETKFNGKEAELSTVTAERDELQRDLDATKLENNSLARQRDEAESKRSDLKQELDEAENKLATIEQKVEAMPEIDMRKKSFGGIKLSVSDAKKLNEGRKSLRELLGIDLGGQDIVPGLGH